MLGTNCYRILGAMNVVTVGVMVSTLVVALRLWDTQAGGEGEHARTKEEEEGNGHGGSPGEGVSTTGVVLIMAFVCLVLAMIQSQFLTYERRSAVAAFGALCVVTCAMWIATFSHSMRAHREHMPQADAALACFLFSTSLLFALLQVSTSWRFFSAMPADTVLHKPPGEEDDEEESITGA